MNIRKKIRNSFERRFRCALGGVALSSCSCSRIPFKVYSRCRGRDRCRCVSIEIAEFPLISRIDLFKCARQFHEILARILRWHCSPWTLPIVGGKSNKQFTKISCDSLTSGFVRSRCYQHSLTVFVLQNLIVCEYFGLFAVLLFCSHSWNDKFETNLFVCLFVVYPTSFCSSFRLFFPISHKISVS